MNGENGDLTQSEAAAARSEGNPAGADSTQMQGNMPTMKSIAAEEAAAAPAVREENGMRIENTDGAKPPEDPMLPEPSKTKATLGRIVWIHSPRTFRHGPYPAIVVADFGGKSSNVNVQVFLDEANEPRALEQVRERMWGTTLTSVPVFDPLSPEQRSVVQSRVSAWAEWMPYQQAQAKKHDAAEDSVASEFAKLRRAIGRIGKHLSNDGSSICDDLCTILARPRAELVAEGEVIPAELPTAAATGAAPISVSVDACAAKSHALWLSQKDRSYSPFNKPWKFLTHEERAQVSRQILIALQAVKEQVPNLVIVDEYEGTPLPEEPAKS